MNSDKAVLLALRLAPSSPPHALLPLLVFVSVTKEIAKPKTKPIPSREAAEKENRTDLVAKCCVCEKGKTLMSWKGKKRQRHQQPNPDGTTAETTTKQTRRQDRQI